MRMQDKRPLNLNLFSIIISSTESNKTSVNKYCKDKKDPIKVVYNKDSTKARNNNDPYSFHFHKVLLVFFLVLIWGLTLYYSWIVPNISLIAYLLAPGMVFVLMTAITAYFIYSICKKYNTKKIVPQENLNIWYQIVLSFASPSWFLARLFKNRLNSTDENDVDRAEKDGMTLFIAYINRANLIVSAFIAAIVFLPLNTWWIGFLMTIVVLRTLSRSFEITLAFGNDALDDNKKSSTLKPNQRLMLAFTSLFECILNYTAVYYLIGQASGGDRICHWQAFVHSFQSALFYSNDLLNYSLYSSKPTALAMLQVTQVITCMTLVFIAFVIYISKTTSDDSNNHTPK